MRITNLRCLFMVCQDHPETQPVTQGKWLISEIISALDAVDFQILNRLTANGRESFSTLGKAVGLSSHGAADRVRRLQQAGVISRFTAVVALANVGRTLDAFIDVRLLPTADSEAFESVVLAIPAVQEVAFVTGRFDYHVRVACQNADELDRTVRRFARTGAQLSPKPKSS